MANSVLLERTKNEIKEKKSGPTTPFRYSRTSGTVGSGIAKFNCTLSALFVHFLSTDGWTDRRTDILISSMIRP